jgi:hypothetical protein
MLNLELKTRKSIIVLREKLRSACEDMGLRLGSSHQKPEYILSKLFNVGTYNELMSKTMEPIESRTLTTEDVKVLYAQEYEEKLFHASDLSAMEARTLLYGYDCSNEDGSSPTFHVYLDNKGNIHALTYNLDQQVIKHIFGKSLPANDLRPDKRAYPSATDAEFAFLLAPLLMHSVSYTSPCENRQPAKYHGLTHDQLDPILDIHLKARNLSLSLDSHIRKYYGETLNEKHLDNSYAHRNTREVYDYTQPKTDAIRKVGFSFGNKKQLSANDIALFKKAFHDEFIIKALSEDEYSDLSDFEQVFTELLKQEIKIKKLS